MEQYFEHVKHNLEFFHQDFKQTKEMYKKLGGIFRFFASELNDFIDTHMTYSQNTTIQNTNAYLLMNMRDLGQLYNRQADHLEE